MFFHLLKIFLFIVSTGLLFAWYRATFNTNKFSSFLGFKASSVVAKSIVRGNIGALYLSVFVMTSLLFLDQFWAYPLLIMALTIVIGRLVSFYFDGYSKMLLCVTVIESSCALVLLIFIVLSFE